MENVSDPVYPGKNAELYERTDFRKIVKQKTISF